MQFPYRTNKKISFTNQAGIIAIAAAIAGFIISPNALADNAHVASVNFDQTVENEDSSIIDDDSEIGSTYVWEPDTQIGAYSTEDGAMLGAYGDGEYAD